MALAFCFISKLLLIVGSFPSIFCVFTSTYAVCKPVNRFRGWICKLMKWINEHILKQEIELHPLSENEEANGTGKSLLWPRSQRVRKPGRKIQTFLLVPNILSAEVLSVPKTSIADSAKAWWIATLNHTSLLSHPISYIWQYPVLATLKKEILQKTVSRKLPFWVFLTCIMRYSHIWRVWIYTPFRNLRLSILLWLINLPLDWSKQTASLLVWYIYFS